MGISMASKFGLSINNPIWAVLIKSKMGSEQMQAQVKRPDPEIGGIAIRRINQFNDYLASIRDGRYFRPNGRPAQNWLVFYADYIADAKNMAASAAKLERETLPCEADNYISKSAARDSAIDAGKSEEHKETLRLAGSKAWDTAIMSMESKLKELQKEIGLLSLIDDVTLYIKLDFAKDAMLKGILITSSDLEFPLKKEYISYVEEKMKGWMSGYGVADYVNGKLYLYCLGDSPEKLLR